MRISCIVMLLWLTVSCTSSKKSDHDGHSHEQTKGNSKERKDLPKAKMFTSGQNMGAIKLEPLNEISWTESKDVKNMQFKDPVIAFELDSTFYVIPWYAINAHHICNFNISGFDVVVTVCEVCSGSSVFNAVFDGKKKEFRIGGQYNGTICMLDEEDEVWGPFTGEVYTGEQKGQHLTRIHSYQSTWKEWLQSGIREYFVADYPDEFRKGHHPNPIIGDREERKWVYKTLVSGEIDPRMDKYEMIQGVRLYGQSRAYTHQEILKMGVINDTIMNTSIVLISKAKTSIVSAFRSEVLGRMLTFEVSNDMILDRETRSEWSFNGKCLSGEYLGEELEYVENYHEEWFAWAASYPETTIYEGSN